MGNLFNVGYLVSTRSFGFLRTVYFGGKSHSCDVVVRHSFGCNNHRCIYDGFCKDCPHVLIDEFTL